MFKGFTPLQVLGKKILALNFFTTQQIMRHANIRFFNSKSTMKQKDRLVTGLTLIELLVVITIMTIIAAVVFANYRPANQQLALQRSASKLAQDIRRAQEMAMSSAECPSGTGCEGEVPPRYGIYIGTPFDNPDSYILFADTRPLPDGDNGCYNYIAGVFDPIIEDNITFERGVYLSDVDWSNCDDNKPDEHQKTHLTFSPPDPENNIQFGTCDHPVYDTVQCSEITLTLGVEGLTLTRSVVINDAGLIYVE